MQTRRGALLVFIAGATLSCGGSGPGSQGPIVSAEPIMMVAPVARSSCADAAGCQSACAGGDPSACTRAADFQMESDPKAARAAYETSCAKNDGEACARLLELAGGDAEQSDRYARLACGAGHGAACWHLSQLSVLAFAAPRSGEDPSALLTLSEQSSKKACELGHFGGCFNAMSLLERRGASRQEIEGIALRGMLAAETACAERRLGSCGLVAEWGERTKDTESAAVAYLGQCEIAKKLSDQRLEDIESCRRAAKHGKGMEWLAGEVQLERASSAEVLVRQQAIEAKRITGSAQVQPPETELEAMRSSGRTASAIFKLCLTERGGIDSISFLQASPFPGWNRRLFEAMRGWRYWPTTIEGKAAAVCTSVIFLYKAN